MGTLHDLHDQQGQSPWLDNMRRDWIQSGEMQRWIDRGVRGMTSNPTIFQKAIAGQKVGSTVAVAMVSADGYPNGEPRAGILPGDTLVFAIKILAVTG